MCLEPTTNGENRKYEVAVITWVDIEDRTSPSWVPLEEALRDAQEPFQPILTAGIVLWENEAKLSLTASVGPEETAGALSIPKPVILSDTRYRVEMAVPPHKQGHDGEEKVERED